MYFLIQKYALSLANHLRVSNYKECASNQRNYTFVMFTCQILSSGKRTKRVFYCSEMVHQWHCIRVYIQVLCLKTCMLEYLVFQRCSYCISCLYRKEGSGNELQLNCDLKMAFISVRFLDHVMYGKSFANSFNFTDPLQNLIVFYMLCKIQLIINF